MKEKEAFASAGSSANAKFWSDGKVPQLPARNRHAVVFLAPMNHFDYEARMPKRGARPPQGVLS
jgi:hypothetical protein